MAFGVFITRPDSRYNDIPSEQYQFPQQYLSRATRFEGDWIIYYEPRKLANTRGYFAVAKVDRIVPDPRVIGMYLALIEPGTYLDLAKAVDFADLDGPVERGLLNTQGKISGRAQSAVRTVSPTDFNRIVELGLDDATSFLPRVDHPMPLGGMADETSTFDYGPVARVRALSSRAVRDRVFRSVVLRAYNERCAVTGLRLINGGGRAEAEAARIKPVEAGGPDIVSNGLALSGTAHWMFDRGLISLADDMRIIVSRQVNDPVAVNAVINQAGFAAIPRRDVERPHPRFLEWHREHCFKH